MLALRSLVFNVLFYALMIFLMVVGLPTVLFGRAAVFRLARLWARCSLWLLRAICGLRVEFRGVENLPKGGALFAAKHQSMLETFALTLHGSDFSFILKRELTLIPVFGWYLKAAEQIAIDRKSGRSALDQAVERSKAALAVGRQIFIFPEGTRRAPGAPPLYKTGVSYIYAAADAPCVPIALNTGLFWGRRSFVRRP
ncbi:MAG TPA: lysophospholipid acyltransferase family protein, partial [Beijerinckiaceae bacterium]